MSAGGHVAPREAVYTPISYRSSREDQPYKSVISPKLNVSRTNSISNNFDVVPASSLPALKARSQPPAQVNNVTPNSNSASSSPQYRNKNEDWTYSKGNTVVKGSGGCRLYGSILHNCRQQGALYHDQDFEANDTSIYFSRLPPCQFVWKRCTDITKKYGLEPKFFVDGVSGFDVQQGTLGDSWLLAAISCLAGPGCSSLFHRVVPLNQGFQDNEYCGAFYFNFWYFGEWVEVIVDDYLPTNQGQLCFVHSSKHNEFWPALLEKAYAKLYGSYEALKVCIFGDVLTDLTGGLTESYIIRGPDANTPAQIINILFKALDRYSIVACGINSLSSERGKVELPNGLVTGHIYSVTDLRQLLLPSEQGNISVTLIRIRNPWGRRIEWNGPWSVRSVEWLSIPPDEREKLGLVFHDDGEFWMNFKAFQDHFDTLDICNLTPDSPINMPRKWFTAQFHNRWYKGFSAGGRPSHKTTHWSNPQYRMILSDVDEDDDDVCSVIIQLIQKDRRKIKLKNPSLQYIGFVIYKNDLHHPLPLQLDFFKKYSNVASVDAFLNGRQVIKRFALKPGEYIVVPCTYDANLEASFLIRFFMEKANLVEFVDNIPAVVSQPPKDFIEESDSEQFKKFFYKVSGEDMEIDPFDLQTLLTEEFRKDPVHQQVGLDACKVFVSLMDTDNSGKIAFSEFLILWSYILAWKRIFYEFDPGRTGYLSSYELQRAINAGGYKLSFNVMRILCFHYTNERQTVSINSFLLCMARLMKLFNTFRSHQQKGQIVLTIEKWLEKSLMV